MTLTSPLIWVGNKRWQVHQIRPLWESYSTTARWVEPFCGSISMALALQPREALLNDANPYLINFYEWIQRGWHDTPEDLPDHTKEQFYCLRDEFNTKRSHTSLDDAKRFYWLNRMCFKGLFRVNRSGAFNTPYGYRHNYRHKSLALPTSDAYRKQLERWIFTTGSYTTIKRHPTDFLYVDPPYDTEFTSYVADDFTWEEQIAVAEWCAAHTGPVVLCNQATPRITELYTRLGFHLVHVSRIERMRRSQQGRASEVIALRNVNYPQESLF